MAGHEIRCKNRGRLFRGKGARQGNKESVSEHFIPAFWNNAARKGPNSSGGRGGSVIPPLHRTSNPTIPSAGYKTAHQQVFHVFGMGYDVSSYDCYRIASTRQQDQDKGFIWSAAACMPRRSLAQAGRRTPKCLPDLLQGLT